MQNGDFWTTIISLYAGTPEALEVRGGWSVSWQSQQMKVAQRGYFFLRYNISWAHGAISWHLGSRNRPAKRARGPGNVDNAYLASEARTAATQRLMEKNKRCLEKWGDSSRPSCPASGGLAMGPRPHLSFCACQTAWLGPEWQAYMGSNPHLWLCAWKTATLGPDFQVCMGHRPHLWFWAQITACLAQEWIDYIDSSPDLCVLCMQNSAFRTRITSLCGSQTSPVIFCLQTSVPSIVSMGPSPPVWFLDAKQRLLDRINKCLWLPSITCRFVHAKQRD